MNVNNEHSNLVRLGDFIEEVGLKVGENNHIEISGINLEQGFIPTVADMNGIDKSKYKLVPSECFACNLMHIGRDVKIPIAYNYTHETIAVSPAYYVFKIKENEKGNILGYYLEMLLTRSEFGRLAWFHTDSSIRGNLVTDELNDIQIALPDIDAQRELVDTYSGLKALAEQNEALIKPLTEACQAYIVDCKKKYPEVELNGYIEEVNEKNSEGKYTDVLGLSTLKQFREPNSRVDKNELRGYKIVYNNCFAYVPTTDTWKVFACALNKGSTIVVSPIYCVFRVANPVLLSEYLSIIFQPKEFDRYVRYNSWGSARENFNFSELRNVRIPLPPPEVQQAIVDVYNCAEEAKKIASEAREKMKMLCPALVQRAINN